MCCFNADLTLFNKRADGFRISRAGRLAELKAMKAEAEQMRVAARGQGPLGSCVVERTERGRRDEDRGGSRGEQTPWWRVELEQQAKHKADAQGKRG